MKKGHVAVFLLAGGLAVAFRPTTTREVTPGPLKNFIYTAYPSDNPTDLGNPENYELTSDGGTEIPFCSGITHRCSVVAEDDGTGHPDFSRPYTIKTRS